MPSFIIHTLPSRKEYKYCLRQWTSHRSSNYRNNSVIRQIWDISYDHMSIAPNQSAISTQNTIIMINLIVIFIVIFIVIAIVIHDIKWTVTESHFGANKCPFSLSSNTAENVHTLIVMYCLPERKWFIKVAVKPLYMILKDMGEFCWQPSSQLDMSVIDYMYHSQA